LAVDHISVQWLRVFRDEECERAYDTLGHDALVNREGSGVLCVTDKYLTVEALWTRRVWERVIAPMGMILWLTEGLPLLGGKVNLRDVPAVMAPVLVIVKGGLAEGWREKRKKGEWAFGCKFRVMREKCVPWIPRSQFETKPPTMERTSGGERGMSNACGMGAAALKVFKRVWWRASMGKMEAATVRTRGSSMRWAAPEYAPTPTFSTSRALVAMVETSVSKLDVLNVQFKGVPPNALRVPSTAETWVDSSDWMVVMVETAASPEVKPALRKSAFLNFCSACW
jgi:hypothetical protein